MPISKPISRDPGLTLTGATVRCSGSHHSPSSSRSHIFAQDTPIAGPEKFVHHDMRLYVIIALIACCIAAVVADTEIRNFRLPLPTFDDSPVQNDYSEP